MEMQLRDWSCERIQALSAEQRLALTNRAAGKLLQSKVLLGRCLLVMQRLRSYEEAGSSSVQHYATLELGIDEREVREALLVATRLEILPVLTEAVECDAISWSKLKLVLRRADPENEAFWLERAQSLHVRGLERLVRREAERLGEGEAEWTRLEVLLPAEIMVLFQHAVRDLSEQSGRRLSVAECLECLVAEHLSGSPFPEEAVKNKLMDQAARDLAAREDCSWAAAAAEEVECAGLQVVKSAPAHWENSQLRFKGEARGVTPAQRREILRRDGYQCAVPGCPHKLWLQIHHVVFYCRGGATVPGNLVVLCSRCHRHLHRGLIALGEDRVWRDKTGRELGVTHGSHQLPPIGLAP